MTSDVKRTENWRSRYLLEKESPGHDTNTTSIWSTKEPEAGSASTCRQREMRTGFRFPTTPKHNQEPFLFFFSHHHQLWLGKPEWCLKLHPPMPTASCKTSSSFSSPGNQCKYKMDSGGQNQGIKNSLISVYHGT